MPMWIMRGPSTIPPPTPIIPASTPAKTVAAIAVAAVSVSQCTSSPLEPCRRDLATRRRPPLAEKPRSSTKLSAVIPQYASPHTEMPMAEWSPFPPRSSNSASRPNHTQTSETTSAVISLAYAPAATDPLRGVSAAASTPIAAATREWRNVRRSSFDGEAASLARGTSSRAHISCSAHGAQASASSAASGACCAPSLLSTRMRE
mmetsp:Transcript_18832/g.43283  ORF Transcript_18832/g.43283 Transcript_18832/m.43283 type:complete len:204 (-) Transcript_18832:262-873(-)